MRVRIQKRAEVTGGYPARPANEHEAGKETAEGFSIPVDYWIEGELQSEIAVGQSVVVLRDIRNGVKCLGLFQTSPVTEVTETTFRTRNSVYDYSYLTTGTETVSLSA